MALSQTLHSVPGEPSSVTDHRDYDGSLAPAHVAFQVDDLLPGAQYQLAVGDGHGQRWPEQRRLQMRVAVAIMPGLFVAVVAAGRDELVQYGGQITLQPRLELNGADRSCAPDVENIDCAGPDPGLGHHRSNLLSDVVHVTVPFCHDENLLLIAHRLIPGPCRVSRHAFQSSTIQSTDKPGLNTNLKKVLALCFGAG